MHAKKFLDRGKSITPTTMLFHERYISGSKQDLLVYLYTYLVEADGIRFRSLEVLIRTNQRPLTFNNLRSKIGCLGGSSVPLGPCVRSVIIPIYDISLMNVLMPSGIPNAVTLQVHVFLPGLTYYSLLAAN